MSLDKVKAAITEHADFPEKGVTFRDVHPVCIRKNFFNLVDFTQP